MSELGQGSEGEEGEAVREGPQAGGGDGEEGVHIQSQAQSKGGAVHQLVLHRVLLPEEHRLEEQGGEGGQAQTVREEQRRSSPPHLRPQNSNPLPI